MLKIVQAPSAVLATEAKQIVSFDASLQKLIKEMTKTLEAAKDPEGVGLAAPQVGVSLRLFIIKESSDAPLRIFVNPVIEDMRTNKQKKSDGKKNKSDRVKLEGCLSLQDIWGVVRRSDTVTLSYQDETGQKHRKKFTGFLAVIIQHEFDHISGILFPKRVLEQNEKLYKAKKDKSGEIIFEELHI